MSRLQLTDHSNPWTVRLEVGNYCNLRCPLCVREWVNKDLLNNIHLSVDDVKKFLPKKFLRLYVCTVYLSGAVAEPTLNPDLIEIVKYLMEHTGVHIDTNGSTSRPEEWWRELGETGVECEFAPDSLKPDNNVYRINSNTDRVIRNMKAFISGGGKAFWKHIPYTHNDDEQEEQREIAESIGAVFEIAQPRPMPQEKKEDLGINMPDSLGNNDVQEVPFYENNTPHFYCKMLGNIGNNLIEISPEGIVYPCCMMPTEFYFFYGNYFLNGDTTPYTSYDWVNKPDPKRQSFQETILPLIEENGGIESLSLHHHTIQEILDSPFYQRLLKDSWDDKCNFCNNHCNSSQYKIG